MIFDCDGVLVDSEPISNTVLTEILRELGLCLTYDQAIHLFLGRSWSDNLVKIKQLLGRTPPPDLHENYNQRMFRAFEENLMPVKGVKEALSIITNEICDNVCVASSGSHQKINKTLSLTGLYPIFKGRIFSATDVIHGKPAPDLFLKAFYELGSQVKTTVVIEDALPGVQAAVSANIRALAYTPEGPPDLFIKSGAIPFKKMADLPEIIRSL